MKKEIIEFNLLTKGEQKFERGYFYTLFMEIDEEDIDNIYKNLPNSNKLSLKMQNYFCNKDVELELHSKEMINFLLRLDFEEKKSVFLKDEEFTGLLSKWEFVYLEDYNKVVEFSEDDELSQIFFDNVIECFVDDVPRYILSSLYGALYGLTNDFDLRLYLFEPLLTFSYTGEYMFQFKRLGGVYAIKDDVVYYSFKKS